MATSDFAIIIPTLNEEHYIGGLLDSIAAQTLQPKEIVVVDAQSKDKTIEEIKKRQRHLHQLRYYQIPKYTISRQRNLGVKKTKAPRIIFLDADVELKDKNTLKKYLDEVKQRGPDIASCTNVANSSDWRDQLFYRLMDISFKLIKPFWPLANTINWYIRRDVFERVGGFDDKLKVGEDHELLRRVVKDGGKFLFLKEPKVFTSPRRIHKEGRVKFALLMLFALGIVIFLGYRRNKIKYEFGKFGDLKR